MKSIPIRLPVRPILIYTVDPKAISLDIGWKDLAFWSEGEHQWKVEPGDFLIELGSSSQDIKQKITVSY